MLLAIDEAQLIDRGDLRRILAGVHRCGQDSLPFGCVLAGLPNLIGVVAHAATYAERMFVVSELGPLTPDQVGQALEAPAEELNVALHHDAVEAIIDHSDGFPFFVQTWGYHTWNTACDEPISLADVNRAAVTTNYALDTSFFAARVARIPTSELTYVRGLAQLGPGPHESRAVAAQLGTTTSKISAFRDGSSTKGSSTRPATDGSSSPSPISTGIYDAPTPTAERSAARDPSRSRATGAASRAPTTCPRVSGRIVIANRSCSAKPRRPARLLKCAPC